MDSLKQKIEKLIEPADIKINGERPWDIQVNDVGFTREFFQAAPLLLERVMWTDGGK